MCTCKTKFWKQAQSGMTEVLHRQLGGKVSEDGGCLMFRIPGLWAATVSVQKGEIGEAGKKSWSVAATNYSCQSVPKFWSLEWQAVNVSLLENIVYLSFSGNNGGHRCRQHCCFNWQMRSDFGGHWGSSWRRSGGRTSSAIVAIEAISPQSLGPSPY